MIASVCVGRSVQVPTILSRGGLPVAAWRRLRSTGSNSGSKLRARGRKWTQLRVSERGGEAPSVAGSLRLGAGRSQVQILSPRLDEPLRRAMHKRAKRLLVGGLWGANSCKRQCLHSASLELFGSISGAAAPETTGAKLRRAIAAVGSPPIVRRRCNLQGVRNWPDETVSKTVVRLIGVPRVRISPPPL